MKAHIDSNTVVVGDFNTSPSPKDRSSKQKINKEILELHDTINQMDLSHFYRIIHPTKQCTFFSAAHGIFSKIDHTLRHKASLSKCKKIEITPSILSDHSALKVELNNNNKSRKYANNWRLNNTLLNDQWAIAERREEVKMFMKLIKIKTQPTRTYGMQQRQS
jgi:hypothetical protein